MEKQLRSDFKSKNVTALLKKSLSTTLVLLRIMIPISIIIKALDLLGWVEHIGVYLSGVMSVVGLPGEFGLVWGTAMLTNIYGGLVVFFNLTQAGNIYTVLEVTVLAGMILVAHSLLLEARIAQKAGVSLWFTLLWRIGGAIIFGIVSFQIFSWCNWYSSPAQVVWIPNSGGEDIMSWVVNQCWTYLMIFMLISFLIFLMHFLEKVGIIDWLNNRLEPGLEWLGMSRAAAPLAIIGVTLGLSYGGGLIITEAKSGKLSRRDKLLSLSILGHSHSLIEDSLLMLSIGAAFSGIVIGRILFTIVSIMFLSVCIRRVSEQQLKVFTIQ